MMNFRGRLALAIVLALCLSSCQTDTTQKQSIRIINKTDQPIVLVYDEPGHHMELGTLDPDRISVVESVFTELGPGCHGPFVARRSDGTEVARLDRACSGTDWSVQTAAPS